MLDLNPTSQELESTKIPDSDFFQRLVERMGESAVRERLAREEVLRVKMAPTFRFSEGMADRRWPVRLLDSIIRWSFLGNRARRNFEEIRLQEKEWKIAGLSDQQDGLRILQATDFHLDFDPTVVGRLEKVLSGVDYDLVCLTGDFFDLVFEEDEIDTQLFDALISLFRKPIYGVLGNHDLLAVADLAEKRGVRMLMNESEVIGGEEDGLLLAGVDDPRLFRTHSFQRALGDRVENMPAVMLAHSPQVYSEAAEWEIDLMLCGHTHGGQVGLPGGISFPSRFRCPRRMVSGAWSHNSLQGYTANGCGGCKLPYRLNAPAEVTVHTLRKEH